MTNDLDIQFGDVEEAEPESRLRPDENKHFAVLGVYSPHADDLPVFVDLDALRDMEEHALSDARVELGGVMLGGQYKDGQGRPFVLVTDSLRAKHYESTKGSFKFTHDTWSEITRERDEFPDDVQMVGWYHTHPDWGVFLSGMDMFICDNFFNRPLDVALVIDPCRQDRGFFQWTGDDTERTRRTGGFYLTASRFRQSELEEYVTYLEGKFAMSGDPRFRGMSGAAPIVNVGGQQPWQNLAVLGMLTLQFCLLALIAWRLLVPAKPQQQPAAAKQIAALQTSLDQLAEAQRTRAEIDAKLEVLDSVIRSGDGSSGPLLESLAAKTAEVNELRSNVRAQEALATELDTKIARLGADLSDAAGRERRLDKVVASLEAQGRRAKQRIQDLETDLAEFKPAQDGEKAAEEANSGLAAFDLKWVVGGIAIVLIAVAIAAFLIPRQDESKESPEESDA